MSVFSLIVALLLEQLRPLPAERVVVGPMRAVADFAEEHLNAGEPRHGVIAWVIVAGGLTLLTGSIYFLLSALNPLLGWCWNLAVLYATLGFRQFSHHFTDIHLALRMGELGRARKLLGEWRGQPAEQQSSADVARLAIEESLIASHRHVFAVILMYALFPGPCGAVLYRASCLLAEFWNPGGVTTRFGSFARQALKAIDWLPQRVTATSFAIVGDFEDAVYCWRMQMARRPDEEMGVILASGAGALGVRLGMPLAVEPGATAEWQDFGVGDEADADFMQSTVGLVWRALVLCLLLLFMLSLARWAGV